ncbi:MAG: efflux RND transporter periplasmic adaptor subunit [Candidatus Eisenbacteria bacterium]|uniref:Efflux RND transporter periplasmic adaptor subunit n=1 Tax=Eiseniibacteriota bacterium TaxID=2212470 RepID=A0A948S0W7_UNCEI|nr:efflux RND transporter periplasmic adaptor subunit [Candidatus Eisenbacteria bacterium]MBU1950350.1 efflux RND transporter periplasmic adaptor subunit [Candidatus Eisenbacteria bacterium]MBU2692817.1 efflux RND transporter periplasmic adaptor subunit [Candidatus Eisenbacteria bacterium]
MREERQNLLVPLSEVISLLAGVLILGTAALGFCGCSKGPEAGTDSKNQAEIPRNVRVLDLTPSSMNEYLTLSGPTRPFRGTDLSAEESGSVEAVPFDKGSRVDTSDVLILLDRRLLAAEMKSADAGLTLRSYNEERTRQLYEANSVSKAEMLLASTQLWEAEAAAAAAKIRYERAAIKSPFRGVVTDRYVELGQLVVPGMPVARVIDPYILKLEGAVSEQEIPWLKEGRPAVVTFDGLGETAEGYLYWVGFEADPMTGKFQVEIRIDNPDLKIRPGVIGRAKILKTQHRDVLSIPRDAVVQRPSGSYAFVVENGTAIQRELKLGPDQGLMVIVDDGLKPGEKLIVRGQRDIHDGSAVLIKEETESIDGSIATDPLIEKLDPGVAIQ